MSKGLKIRPRGILRKLLERQMSGLTGNIEQAGYPYTVALWGEDDHIPTNGNPVWWVYEQSAYWVDGFTRAAILLEDGEALSRAQDIIYKVINRQDADGYLGPGVLKEGERATRWPHTVFFRACMALYEYNGDVRIAEALARHYLGEGATHYKWRNVLGVEIIAWLYGILDDPRLLALAEEIYAKYNESTPYDSSDAVALSDKKPFEHGVSYNEYMKLGAILFSHTGKEIYLRASRAAAAKLDKYFMLPGGCICSNEYTVDDSYRQSYETCNNVDYSWSLSYLMNITGDVGYADRIERCVFNAGLGSVTEDFRALQYFSTANQLVLDGSSNHNRFKRGSGWMRYSPSPGTACCPGNVNRLFPIYVDRSWRIVGERIYSSLFGATEVEAELGGGHVRIEESTAYPFETRIKYDVKCDVPFTLCIRRPNWAEGVKLLKNGAPLSPEEKNGYLELALSDHCTVELELECSVRENLVRGGAFVSRGPLVYSLCPQASVTAKPIEGRRPDFPEYDMYVSGEWRYALVGDYTFREGADPSSLSLHGMPTVTARARRITDWELEHHDSVRRYAGERSRRYTDLHGSFTFTPPLKPRRGLPLAEEEETITLYPYGLCKLRLTVMNKV